MIFVQKLLFITLIIFTPNVFSEVEVWQLDGHYYKFNRDHKTDYLVSAKCLNQKCMGVLFLKINHWSLAPALVALQEKMTNSDQNYNSLQGLQ